MINEILLKYLQRIFNKYDKADKVLLFGFRGGDKKINSDVDLWFFGHKLTHLTFSKISVDIDELNTSLSFDILNFNELVKEALINNILKEGVEIYNGKNLDERKLDFSKALKKLEEALEKNVSDNLILDEIIQRFEFTFEQAVRLWSYI